MEPKGQKAMKSTAVKTGSDAGGPKGPQGHIHRNNCCNVSFTVSGFVSLFRFGAFTVHDVACAYCAQVHWHCARALASFAFGKVTFSHQALSEIFKVVQLFLKQSSVSKQGIG